MLRFSGHTHVSLKKILFPGAENTVHRRHLHNCRILGMLETLLTMSQQTNVSSRYDGNSEFLGHGGEVRFLQKKP